MDIKTSEMLDTLAQLLDDDWNRDETGCVGICKGCQYYNAYAGEEESGWSAFCNKCPFFNSQASVKIRELANKVKLEELLDGK